MICLFDLSASFWRNFYATMSGTSAFELTVEKIAWYRDEYKTVAVCLDARSMRKDWYPEYKANRGEKPREALGALRAVEEQVQDWGTPALRCEGYEADDIIATLAEQSWLDETRIVSDDKDLYQLITDNVKLMTKRGETGIFGCVEKFGVLPEQMRDWLALVGDTADNIPGCPSCGPGRARDLLKRFGTLDAIREATDEELLSVRGVGEKTLESIRTWDPSLAVRLVTLMTNAPVKLEDLWQKV